MSAVMERLAGYLLGLYAGDGPDPGGIVADLWARDPSALEAVVRAWLPPGWDPRDRADVKDGAHWFVSVYCRAVMANDLRAESVLNLGATDMQGVMRVIADWALEARA